MTCHIKTILALLDASQQDLADAVKVSRNTITSLSRNNSIPNLTLAYDIRDTFNSWAKEKGIDQQWTVEQIWVR